MRASNRADQVPFLPDDTPILEYTAISGQIHSITGRGESHVPLNLAAPTGKAAIHLTFLF